MERREPFNPLLKSYPDSEKINAVSIGAETLYTRLIARSDDKARYYADPQMVLGKLFTHRMCAGQVKLESVAKWIQELEAKELIRTYEVGGRQYLEILNCKKSLRTDVKPDVHFPDPPVPNSERIRNEFGPPTQPNPTQPNPTNLNPPDGGDDAGADKPPSSGAGSSRQTPKATGILGFDRFWAAWPKHHRKQGKKTCIAKWKRDKLEEFADPILAALERSKASPDWLKQGGEFIPFPMTWLGRSPWETDPGDLGGGGSSGGDAFDEFRNAPIVQPGEDVLRILRGEDDGN